MKKTRKKGTLTDEHKRLVERNLRLVPYCISIIGTNGFDSYEDAYQTGMIALMEAAMNYDGEKSSFSTYAIKSIRNTFCSVRRNAVRRQRMLRIVSLEMPINALDGESISLMDMLAADIPAIDKIVTDREVARKAMELLRDVPSDIEMRFLRLLVFSDKRQSEIADLTGYSQSYVSKMIRQVRATLRERMEEAGYDPRSTA